jgi:hypothetical protein
VSLVLDAGALIALDRNDRAMWRRLKHAAEAGDVPRTHGGVVAQVWRGAGARQARLAMALDGLNVRALDDRLGRAAGALLARTRTRDAIDAALVVLAAGGDEIVTSDPDDLAPLARALNRDVSILRV